MKRKDTLLLQLLPVTLAAALAAAPALAQAPTGTTLPGSTTPSTAVTPGTTTTPGAAMTPGAMHGPVVVIQVGGFLGMGGRLVAIPLSDLNWNTEHERIVMPNASKETLQGRPAFSYDTLRRG